MAEETTTTLDGNEAVAYVAYRVNEICGIYPITPQNITGKNIQELCRDSHFIART